MEPDDVYWVLSSAQEEITDIPSSLDIVGNDVPCLRLETSERWATVKSRGDMWFRLTVDGGLSHVHLDEDIPADEVEQILRTYVDLAVAYMRNQARRTVTPWLRRPRVVISTGGVEYVLRPPLFG